MHIDRYSKVVKLCGHELSLTHIQMKPGLLWIQRAQNLLQFAIVSNVDTVIPS